MNTLQATAQRTTMAKVTIDGIEKEVPDGTYDPAGLPA
jgi:hypothetical protein